MDQFEEGSFLEPMEDGVFLERIRPREGLSEEADETDDFLFGRMEDGTRHSYHIAELDAAEQLHAMGFFTESVLEQVKDGVLPPACGTSAMDLAFVLEQSGYVVEPRQYAEIDELTQALAQDERILCTLCEPNPPDIPFPSKRLVEVIGVDLRSSENPLLCMGDANGSAIEPLKSFIRSWDSTMRACYIVCKE